MNHELRRDLFVSIRQPSGRAACIVLLHTIAHAILSDQVPIFRFKFSDPGAFDTSRQISGKVQERRRGYDCGPKHIPGIDHGPERVPRISSTERFAMLESCRSARRPVQAATPNGGSPSGYDKRTSAKIWIIDERFIQPTR
jgi:hypothetical protein